MGSCVNPGANVVEVKQNQINNNQVAQKGKKPNQNKNLVPNQQNQSKGTIQMGIQTEQRNQKTNHLASQQAIQTNIQMQIDRNKNQNQNIENVNLLKSKDVDYKQSEISQKQENPNNMVQNKQQNDNKIIQNQPQSAIKNANQQIAITKKQTSHVNNQKKPQSDINIILSHTKHEENISNKKNKKSDYNQAQHMRRKIQNQQNYKNKNNKVICNDVDFKKTDSCQLVNPQIIGESQIEISVGKNNENSNLVGNKMEYKKQQVKGNMFKITDSITTSSHMQISSSIRRAKNDNYMISTIIRRNE